MSFYLHSSSSSSYFCFTPLFVVFLEIHLIAYNVSAYLPIYFLYYIIVVFQVQLAQTALGIGHRFQRINIILRTILLNGTYGLLCYKTVTD